MDYKIFEVIQELKALIQEHYIEQGDLIDTLDKTRLNGIMIAALMVEISLLTTWRIPDCENFWFRPNYSLLRDFDSGKRYEIFLKYKNLCEIAKPYFDN